MSKLFCFAFLIVACLAAFTSAQYSRQLSCKNYINCLCDLVPRMIAAARGRQATATVTNLEGKSEVIDLSKPLSGELRAICARASNRARA
ncbi:hypothetical protein ZHAS_00009924 [Anopheles sinensis]|uniref:Uncharacterized protein n=1 Tax=Anopheles sinensis TaxID=74873 RepID=A0A084VW85_ANOSI|nr:hypothetical protein ZHAS_00009924 [Anopheles sinensis]